jgi:HK97 family phage major capsid protein
MSKTLDQMRQARVAKKASLDLLLNKSNPTADDAARADRLITEVRDLDERIRNQSESDERYAAAEANKFDTYGERSESGADLMNATSFTQRSTSSTSVTARQVYTRDAAERGERSYIADLYRGQVLNDPAAMQRLAEHGLTVPREQRDATTSSVSGFTPPQYLSQLWAEYARSGRPTADLCSKFPLPRVGMTVNIPRLTTPTTVAVQATENSAVSNQDPDDTLITANVRTLAGMADISRQAIERGENVDALIMSDLASSYNTALNSQVINGDGTNGQHLGLRNIVGLSTTSYTDATPTFGEAYVKLAEAAGKVMSQRYTGATACIMHPRLWASFIGQVDSDGRPLIVPAGHGPSNAAAVGDTADYNGSAGTLLGIPVVLDGSVPTNLGGGTNETVVIFADLRDVYLFEDSSAAPAQLRFDQPLADTLTVRMVSYGYSALVAGRLPSAISVVTGTGLILT